MQLIAATWLIAALPQTVGFVEIQQLPSCLTKCWENTKYVSKCLMDTDACLCREVRYQKSLSQCLYSQCDTIHLDHAQQCIQTKCFEIGVQVPFTPPHKPDREGLRRREEDYIAGEKAYGSGSADGHLGGRITLRLPTESVNYPTDGAAYATQSVGTLWPIQATSPTPFHIPIDRAQVRTSTASASPVLDMMAVTTTPQPLPELYLGSGQRLRNCRSVPLAITLPLLLLLG